MGLIKLEPAVLRRAAKDLNQSISQLGLECLEALRQNTRKIRMELEDIQRSLRSTATRAEQADREAQQALNGK
mgnify:CR=1 FL=1